MDAVCKVTAAEIAAAQSTASGVEHRPVGMDALVVRGDRCDSCERAYFDGSCECPEDTKVVRLRGFHGDMVYAPVGSGCYGSGFSFDMCLTRATASNTSDPRSISFYTGTPPSGTSGQQVGSSAESDQIGRCVETHSATEACKCPAEMIPRPVLHPVPLGVSGMDVLVTVFCAPVTTTVHIIDAETGACYNPLGLNVSCECVPGAPSVVVPMAFVNVTSTMLRPGLLRFCSALPAEVRNLELLLLTLLAASTVSRGSEQVQAMQMLVPVECDQSEIKVSKTLVPFRVGNGLTSGLAALAILLTAVGLIQTAAVLVTTIVCRRLKGGGALSFSSIFENISSHLKFPSLTVCVGQLAVMGTALESLWILMGPGDRSAADYAVGVCGLAAIVGLCSLVCVYAVKCSRIVEPYMESYEPVVSRYPRCIRWVLPAFYYDCNDLTWLQWSLAFDWFKCRRMYVESVDLLVTSVAFSLAASAVTRRACRGMSLMAAGVTLVSACVLFWARTGRRPLTRIFNLLMKLCNCVIALQKGLPSAFAWLSPDAIENAVIAVMCLNVCYGIVILIFEMRVMLCGRPKERCDVTPAATVESDTLNRCPPLSHTFDSEHPTPHLRSPDHISISELFDTVYDLNFINSGGEFCDTIYNRNLTNTHCNNVVGGRHGSRKYSEHSVFASSNFESALQSTKSLSSFEIQEVRALDDDSFISVAGINIAESACGTRSQSIDDAA